MSDDRKKAMTEREPVTYEAPTLRVLGSIHELTLGCDKKLGSSDGNTFVGQAIVCSSA
jgi:hypothetical protein